MERPSLDEFNLPGTAPGEPATGPWPPAARWAAGCGLGCVGLVVLQGLSLWGMAAFYFSLRRPEGLATRVEAPARVVVGRRFPLTLVVTNGGPRPLTLMSVTARRQTQAAVAPGSPDPRPESVADVMDTVVWTYQKRLEPGETFRVRFGGQAQRAGKLEASLDLQVDLAPVPVRFKLEAVDEKSAPAAVESSDGASPASAASPAPAGNSPVSGANSPGAPSPGAGRGRGRENTRPTGQPD